MGGVQVIHEKGVVLVFRDLRLSLPLMFALVFSLLA
jgi:hypothetical protein